MFKRKEPNTSEYLTTKSTCEEIGRMFGLKMEIYYTKKHCTIGREGWVISLQGKSNRPYEYSTKEFFFDKEL